MRYGPTARLNYPRMAFGSERSGVFLYVPLESIKLWYALDICRPLQNMAVDPVLGIAAIRRLKKIGWRAIEDQKLFLHSYDEEKIMVLPAEPELARHSAIGAKVRENERLEVRRRYRVELTLRGLFLKYARLVWHRYSSAGNDFASISTL